MSKDQNDVSFLEQGMKIVETRKQTERVLSLCMLLLGCLACTTLASFVNTVYQFLGR